MLLVAGTASAQPATDVTFSKDVASILYEKCARCHREGEIAPMSLLTYVETRPWARAIHYTTKGTPDTDQSRIGIIFAEDQPEFHVRTIPVWNTRFRIPAGEANYEVVSEAEFTEDVVLWTLFPHMHMRGKSFEFRLF